MAEQYKSPGWYPDPDGKPGDRWWNGAGWSDSRRGAGAAVAAPAAPRPDPYAPVAPVTSTRTGVTLDFRQNRFATLALILGAVGILGFSIAGPPAVVLGFLGISRARKLKAEGATGNTIVVATIGLVLGGISTFFLIIAMVSFFAAMTFNFDPS